MAGEQELRKRFIIFLSLAGIGVASLAGLSHYFEWLASLCSGFGEGCRETAEFGVLGVPVWLLGVIYYFLVCLLFFRAYGLLFWVIAAGFGVELGLVWIMFSLKTVCVFCLANFVVMTALAICSLQRARTWHILSVTLAALLLSLVIIPYGNSSYDAAVTTERPAVVAKVAGKTITLDELVLPLASRISDLEQQIYRLERERLDQLIAKTVLEKEAEKQQKPAQEMVKEFLASQNITLGDQEVADYYAENRSRWTEWKGSEQELIAQIRAYLLQLKAQERVLAYAKSLNSKYGVELYLKEPRSANIQVSLEKDDPVWGPEDAPLTIFEFSDYQCSACRRNHQAVQELRHMFKDRIKWVFKDFPMPGHKWARGAALAAHCAAEQGKFWQYQDLLFNSQEELSSECLTQLAKDLGLQMEQFNECLEAAKFQAHVERDIEQGKKFGLNTTPTFVINNRLVSGAPPPDRFKQIIDEELEKLGKNS